MKSKLYSLLMFNVFWGFPSCFCPGGTQTEGQPLCRPRQEGCRLDRRDCETTCWLLLLLLSRGPCLTHVSWAISHVAMLDSDVLGNMAPCSIGPRVWGRRAARMFRQSYSLPRYVSSAIITWWLVPSSP